MLERNPELEFSDKVDLDGLVREAFVDFQSDRGRLKATDKQVEPRLPPKYIFLTCRRPKITSAVK